MRLKPWCILNACGIHAEQPKTCKQYKHAILETKFIALWAVSIITVFIVSWYMHGKLVKIIQTITVICIVSSVVLIQMQLISS